MKKLFAGLTAGFIILYTIAAIVVSVNRYWQYQSFYFDFGIFDTAIWKVSRLQPPIVDHPNFGERGVNILGDHFTPSIFLLSPVYWLTERREVMLVFQSLSAGIAAFFAYLIARRYLQSGIATGALVVAFLGYVGLQNALITDFHTTTLAVLPMMVVFWSMLAKRRFLYFLSLIILLGLKESFAGFGVALGVYLLIGAYLPIVGKINKVDKHYYQGLALATIVISLAWGLVVIKYVIPFFSGGLYYYLPESLPANLNALFSGFFDDPIKRTTIFYTYLTFGFIPLLDVAILPLVFEHFLERFVLANKGLGLTFHYNATLSPLMFMGGVYAFGLLEKHSASKKFVTFYAVVIILTVLYLHRVVLHGPLGLFYNPVFYQQNRRVRYVDEFVRNFPKTGKIMTQNDLAVRLTHQDVFLLREDYETIGPDYVILNLTPGQNPNSFYPLTQDKAKLLKDRLSGDNNFRLKKFADELYLFSKINL